MTTEFAEGGYFDGVTITIRVVPYPTMQPVDVLDLRIDGGFHLDVFAAGELLREALSPDGFPPSYTLDVRQSRVSWGASATAAEIVMFVSSAIVGGVLYDALKAALRRIGSEAHSTHEFPVRPLTNDEAIARARWMVERRFELPAGAGEALDLLGVDERFEPRAVTVSLGNEAATYTVDVQETDGLATFTRIAVESLT